MLNYHLDCDPVKSHLRVQQLLTDEVKELVARIATETVDVPAIDPHTCDELRQPRVICVVDGTVLRKSTSGRSPPEYHRARGEISRDVAWMQAGTDRP